MDWSLYLNLVAIPQFHIHCTDWEIDLEAVHVSAYGRLLNYAECVIVSYKAGDCAKGCITS